MIRPLAKAILAVLFLMPVAGHAQSPAPTLEFVMQLRVTLGQPYSAGQTAHGRRTVIPITGGTFSGPLISGTVIAGGADYQLSSTDGHRTDLDAIYDIKADDGTIIHVRNRGIITSPANSHGGYFMAAPQFEVSTDSPHAWLADAIYVCAPDFSQQFQGIVLNVWKATPCN